MKNVLSSDLIVACEIYHINMKGEKAWFNKLVDLLQGNVSRATISKAIEALNDWGIIFCEYGETTPGRAAKIFTIDKSMYSTIVRLYDQFWKETALKIDEMMVD